jgi:hypothetical protein
MHQTIKTTIMIGEDDLNALEADVIINAYTEDGILKVDDWQVVKLYFYAVNRFSGSLELRSTSTLPSVIDDWKGDIDEAMVLEAAVNALT